MTLSETLMLLTLLVTVAYYTFQVVWTITHKDNKKK